MEFWEVVRNRESVRNYDPNRSVDKEILIKILEAGRIAPSAANRQPWKFIMISSNNMLKKVRLCYERVWFQEAPHILVVVGNKTEAWTRGYDNRCFIETDLAIALDHIILAATNEGVKTCWISNFKSDVLESALGLKEHECVFGITPLGYPKSDFKRKGNKERKSIDTIAKWL